MKLLVTVLHFLHKVEKVISFSIYTALTIPFYSGGIMPLVRNFYVRRTEPMKIKPSNNQKKTQSLKLSQDFIEIIEKHIKNKAASDGYLTLSFRDPTYSAETGGYHPVEICINGSGIFQYCTDFSFSGQGGAYAELVKELDFDFSLGLFQHMGRDYPLEEGAELFQIFQSNFVSYYKSGVFEVEVS